MTRTGIATALVFAGVVLPFGGAFAVFDSVTPFAHDDPTLPNLVTAEWRTALGCPTDVNLPFPYACDLSDFTDTTNMGLLISKQGPGTLLASGEAGATLNGLQGTVVPVTA